MKKVKVDNLSGAALDWATAIATGLKPEDLYINNGGGKQYMSIFRNVRDEDGNLTGYYMTGPDLLFSSKWEAAGPIIEREKINIECNRSLACNNIIFWEACTDRFEDITENAIYKQGITPLEAAMRCYVASKLGEEVEIPEGLLK